jgi:hypothetical protein
MEWPSPLIERLPDRRGVDRRPVERTPGDVIASATDDDGLCVGSSSSTRRHGFAMGGIETLLVAPFQRNVAGDERPILKDADLISEDVDVENAPARRIRDAVEIAADADHALMRDPTFELEDRVIGDERQWLPRR